MYKSHALKILLKNVGILGVVVVIGCAQTTSTTSTTVSEIRPSQCFENQMAFDIGSGSSKVLFATVDTCLQKIEKVHWQDSFPLKIKESLKNNQNKIPDEMSASLITKIQIWKSRAGRRSVQRYKAVATEAFRKARNGSQFLKNVSAKTQVPIRIIDHLEEGHLGFWSALAKGQLSAQDVVVWDIGGGSMQITSLSKKNLLKSYLGPMGAVSFKDQILKMKRDHLPMTSNIPQLSPNPLGEHFSFKAIQMAQSFADEMISPEIKAEVKQKQVVGIGGVHGKSILPRATEKENAEVYTEPQLAKALQKYQSLSDAEIGGLYPETDVTNMAMVLGFMRALRIQEVKVVSVDLTYGLLTLPDSKPH